MAAATRAATSRTTKTRFIADGEWHENAPLPICRPRHLAPSGFASLTLPPLHVTCAASLPKSRRGTHASHLRAGRSLSAPAARRAGADRARRAPQAGEEQAQAAAGESFRGAGEAAGHLREER